MNADKLSGLCCLVCGSRGNPMVPLNVETPLSSTAFRCRDCECSEDHARELVALATVDERITNTIGPGGFAINCSFANREPIRIPAMTHWKPAKGAGSVWRERQLMEIATFQAGDFVAWSKAEDRTVEARPILFRLRSPGEPAERRLWMILEASGGRRDPLSFHTPAVVPVILAPTAFIACETAELLLLRGLAFTVQPIEPGEPLPGDPYLSG